MGVSRRQMIAGIGSATAVGAFATFGTAKAAPSGAGGFPFGDGSVFVAGDVVTSAAVILTPGLSYINIDPTAFGTFDSATGMQVFANGVGVVTPPGALVAPISLPIGSTLKEVTIGYVSPAGTCSVALFRKVLNANYAALGPATPLTAGAAILTTTISLNEAIDGQSSYMAAFVASTTAQRASGLLVGYTPPPQAFVPVSPVNRVLDTRNAGGKLNLNEERTVVLGVPGIARAAVINLTVVETEGLGFVAAFPANTAYNGNSNINWNAPDTVTANGVITAVDPTGSIKLRCGGAGRTHVIVDVQGYLL